MLHHQIGKHTGHTKRGVHQTRDVSERRGHQAVELAVGDGRWPQRELPFQTSRRHLQYESHDVDRDQHIRDHRCGRSLSPAKSRPRLSNRPGTRLDALHTLLTDRGGAHAVRADVPSTAVAADVRPATGMPVTGRRPGRRLWCAGCTHRTILACVAGRGAALCRTYCVPVSWSTALPYCVFRGVKLRPSTRGRRDWGWRRRG